MTENGCSEDLPVPSNGFPPAEFAGSCFCRKTQRRRTARRTTIGALSRTSAWQAGVSYSATFCESRARSTPRRRQGGERPSRFLDDDAGASADTGAVPEDRCAAVASDASIVQLRLSDMRLCRPRQWGACWLAGQLWRDLRLEQFWAERLPPNRKVVRAGIRSCMLVSCRLIAPGSEWKLHRDWFGKSAMADLLGADFGLAEAHKLCRLSRLSAAAQRRAILTSDGALVRPRLIRIFDVLLYDLTQHLFHEINASDVAEGDKRHHGYSRDKRPDLPAGGDRVGGYPGRSALGLKYLAGNTNDCKTLRMFLDKIEKQLRPRTACLGDGSRHPHRTGAGRNAGQRIRRCSIWWERRKSASLVWEKQLLDKPWQQARRRRRGQTAGKRR